MFKWIHRSPGSSHRLSIRGWDDGTAEVDTGRYNFKRVTVQCTDTKTEVLVVGKWWPGGVDSHAFETLSFSGVHALGSEKAHALLDKELERLGIPPRSIVAFAAKAVIGMRKCWSCGRNAATGTFDIYDQYDVFVCSDCLHEDYHQCFFCGRWYPDWRQGFRDGYPACPGCL